MPNSLQDHFWRAEKQNISLYKNYCKCKVIEEEELLMQALAEELEDDVPDDGAIEIDFEDEYHANQVADGVRYNVRMHRGSIVSSLQV
ncbi:hypothetical protein DFH09DRAFT_1328519 [Mycena vulgaris]|nr:hypothetical protein DFH09DRAFT_1328519 [Mycena vulgaris]